MKINKGDDMKLIPEIRMKMHPTLNIIVREDGAVYGGKNPKWTYGRPNRRGGYLTVHFTEKPLYVHRLVAETFLENPYNKPTVDHINRIRTDNCVRNLRWATRDEQMDNSSKVLDRTDYGVRKKDGPLQYYKNRYKTKSSKYRKYSRDSYRKKKEAGWRYVLTSTGSKFMPGDIAEKLLSLPVEERVYP